MQKYVDLQQELDTMDAERLEVMLHAETQKEIPNDDLVLLILNILEKRDADKPLILGPEAETAWKLYQKRVRARAWRPSLLAGWIIRAASILVVLGLLFVMLPQQAQADSIWDMLVRWTADVAEFFGHQDNEHRIVEYAFKTENPGLQQVYDAVVERGVTEPIVPMELLDGSELVQFEMLETRVKTQLHSRFESKSGEIVFNIDIYHMDVVHEYQKNEADPIEYECGGIIHYLVKNNERWTAMWSRDNVECAIYIDCNETELKSIIKTVYDCEDE